jgi:hypothetical protein
LRVGGLRRPAGDVRGGVASHPTSASDSIRSKPSALREQVGGDDRHALGVQAAVVDVGAVNAQQGVDAGAEQPAHCLGFPADRLQGAIQPVVTPLATILSASLAMQRTPGRRLEESTADLLRRLASTARRLDRQLTDLINLERLDWSSISLARRPVDIAVLLHRVATRWRSETHWPQVHAPLGDRAAGSTQGRVYR